MKSFLSDFDDFSVIQSFIMFYFGQNNVYILLMSYKWWWCRLYL